MARISGVDIPREKRVEVTVGQTVRVSPALFQPIAAEDVAATLASIAVSRRHVFGRDRLEQRR